MRKRKILKSVGILTFLAIAAVVLTLTATATAQRAKPLAEKDGLRAEMSIEGEKATVTVTNVDGDFVKNIKVAITSPDGSNVKTYESFNLAKDESKSIVYSIEVNKATEENTEEKPTETLTDDTASDPVPGESRGGCSSAIKAGGVFIIVIAIAAALIMPKKKSAALLLAAIMLISAGTLGISAESNVRSFEVSEFFISGEEKQLVCAKISYEFEFSEEKQEGTKGMKQFEITYYWGPHYVEFSEDIVKTIAECGFTSIPIEHYSVDQNKAALKNLKKYGLTCSALWDPRIEGLLSLAPSTPQETFDAVIAEVAADYKEFDNVIGYYIKDEPNTSNFAVLGKIVSAIRRLDPGKEPMINLFPTYAKASQLGASTYSEYLNRFVDEVDPMYLSYDHYHFMKSKVRAGFYANLEEVRKCGLEKGIDQMDIILLTEHLSYANLTKEQIEWEVNVSLAYGMKRISYFTYWLDDGLLAQGWTNACVDSQGRIYDHYYNVQAINKWLKPLGDELFGKTSTAVYYINCNGLESGCKPYKGYGRLGEVSGSNFLVGFFDDNSFMIVNKSYVKSATSKKELTLIDITDGLEYFDTETATWKSADGAPFCSRDGDGHYVLTFEASQGILLR